MKELFLPYDLSILAKDKGFDERGILAYFNEYHNSIINHTQYNIEFTNNPNYGWSPSDFNKNVSAILYQQIIDWLREKHKLHITIIPLGSQLKKKTITMYDVYVNNDYMYADINLDKKGDGVPELKTYYEALNKGIEIALNSIEI